MIFVERAGLAAGFARRRSSEHKRHIGASRSPRSGRSAAQQPRSGLTATVRVAGFEMKPMWPQQPGYRGRGVGSPSYWLVLGSRITHLAPFANGALGNGSARPSISSRERLRRRRRCTSKGERPTKTPRTGRRRKRDSNPRPPHYEFEGLPFRAASIISTGEARLRRARITGMRAPSAIKLRVPPLKFSPRASGGRPEAPVCAARLVEVALLDCADGNRFRPPRRRSRKRRSDQAEGRAVER